MQSGEEEKKSSSGSDSSSSSSSSSDSDTGDESLNYDPHDDIISMEEVIALWWAKIEAYGLHTIPWF